MEEIAQGNHLRHFIRRLAKATENDLFKAFQIAEAIRRRHHLFHGRIAVTEPQIVPVIAATLVSYTKITTVGAFIRQVYVQIAVEGVKVGILAVFFLIVPLIILVVFILILGLALLLRLSLPFVIVVIIVVLILLVVALILLRLGLFLDVLRLIPLHLLLGILRLLRLLLLTLRFLPLLFGLTLGSFCRVP